MRQIAVGREKYAFIAIDACLQPGPRRPFNFVGALDAGEIEKIHELAADSRRNKSDYIFWFGHYPTSCIIAQCDDGVRSLMGTTIHFHYADLSITQRITVIKTEGG